MELNKDQLGNLYFLLTNRTSAANYQEAQALLELVQLVAQEIEEQEGVVRHEPKS